MRNEAKHLVQALHDVPVRPDRARVFPAELRRRAVAWYRAKRVQGVACLMIGDSLGIHPVLLASWACSEQTQGLRQIELLGSDAPSALKPVAQVQTVASQRTPHAAQDSAPNSGWTLISHRGCRLEGLDVLFIGKDRRRAKVFLWDGTGLMMGYRQLAGSTPYHSEWAARAGTR